MPQGQDDMQFVCGAEQCENGNESVWDKCHIVYEDPCKSGQMQVIKCHLDKTGGIRKISSKDLGKLVQ